MTEGQLMELAFEAIGEAAQQLDFSRIVVVAELDPAALVRASARGADELPAGDASEASEEAGSARASAQAHALTKKQWHGAEWQDALPIALALTQDPKLTPAQRELLSRATGRYLPTLHLRRLSRASALLQLRTFVLAFRTRGHRHVRIVCGKGISSAAEPVLKPEVLRWCDTSGSVLGFAPELDPDGDFGSLILELRSPRRPHGDGTR
jgi:DNA-nicking Smr family endonuclease